MDLHIELEIAQGEFVSLFGESGAGKTTILRMLAGLMMPDEGSIEVEGQVWFDSRKKINLPVQRRSLGFVFQNALLFPNMTVKQNLEFALQEREDSAMISGLLENFEMKELENQKPQRLSSGQQQRVAVIRALLRKPKLFLFDEPFCALDVPMRIKLQDQILQGYRETKTTTIFVSHEISDIFKLSGKVLVVQDGRILKQGSPAQALVSSNVSGKFRFAGHICEIKKEPPVNIVTILIGNTYTKIVATDDEIKNLAVGDKVIVVSKAFNPVILKC